MLHWQSFYLSFECLHLHRCFFHFGPLNLSFHSYHTNILQISGGIILHRKGDETSSARIFLCQCVHVIGRGTCVGVFMLVYIYVQVSTSYK